jgi:fructosamine-3-kinase
MIPELIKNKIQEIRGETITGIHSVAGGCISEAYIIKFSDGKDYFIKINPDEQTDMYLKEANGLKELKKAGALRIPEVSYADQNFILMERINAVNRVKDFFSLFGKGFSLLHRTTADSFGFFENNYIGSTLQVNIPKGKENVSWPEFYLNNRILFQYRLAEKNGYGTEELRKVISIIEMKIFDLLNGSQEPPSLLHGDLWSGNFLIDENGTACLIDPAVYYGHREADLAMTRLFGGFDIDFYESYQYHFPLPDGYPERENIYKLYHALNHLNLFGKGYYNQTLSLARFYI